MSNATVKTGDLLAPNNLNVLKSDVSLEDVVLVLVERKHAELLAAHSEAKGKHDSLSKELEEFKTKIVKDAEAKYRSNFEQGMRMCFAATKSIKFSLVGLDEGLEVLVRVEVSNGKHANYGNRGFDAILPVLPTDQAHYDHLQSLKAEAAGNIANLITEIRNLPLKERQIKAELAMRKLANAGLEDLLADPKLNAVLQLSAPK